MPLARPQLPEIHPTLVLLVTCSMRGLEGARSASRANILQSRTPISAFRALQVASTRQMEVGNATLASLGRTILPMEVGIVCPAPQAGIKILVARRVALPAHKASTLIPQGSWSATAAALAHSQTHKAVPRAQHVPNPSALV